MGMNDTVDAIITAHLEDAREKRAALPDIYGIDFARAGDRLGVRVQMEINGIDYEETVITDEVISEWTRGRS